MAKGFRDILKGIIPNRNWKKYLKYALGEITLLVVGILIALQINNWNENRKHDSQLTEILRTVESDLIRDTVTVSRIIEFYEVLDTLAEKFIQKDVTPEYYKN